MMGSDRAPARRVGIRRARLEQGEAYARDAADLVAVEEPLQIRLLLAGEDPRGKGTPLALTMRTPGNDVDLAAGFLFGEGVVAGRDDIVAIRRCQDPAEAERHNILKVHLRSSELPSAARLERHFAVNSACGVCGKAHLEALEVRCPTPLAPGPRLSPEVLAHLPGALRAAQTVFGRTGGLHAAGLFTRDGELVALREDVGRHNALDKLVGWALLEGRLPLAEHVVCVSGRASYELAQKAVVARAAVLAAVSAPSSLAVDVARRFGLTLVGFLRDERFNVYAGEQRLDLAPSRASAQASPISPGSAIPTRTA